MVGTKFDVYIVNVEKDTTIKIGTHTETISSVHWLNGMNNTLVSISNAKEIFKYRIVAGSYKETVAEAVPVVKTDSFVQPEVIEAKEAVTIPEEKQASIPEEVEQEVKEEEPVTPEDTGVPVIDKDTIKELIDDLDYSIEGMMDFWGSIIDAGVEEELISDHFETIKQEMMQVKFKLMDLYPDSSEQRESSTDTKPTNEGTSSKVTKPDNKEKKAQFKF
ncbi:MAG: hypothetical protein ACTSP4_17395 [Candidatus Hodarchaeales archaeon]